MREMKDSGIEWIDAIPLDWTVKPLKWIVKFGKGLPITKDNLIEQGIPVVSYGQIHSKANNGTHLQDDLMRFVSETYLKSNPLSLGKKGDIFFADTSEDYAGIGNAVLVDIDIPVFAGYHTVIVRLDDQSYSRYLAYLFLTGAWRSQLCSMTSGIKVFSITQGLLKRTTVLLPPAEKTVAMTDYLDRKCSQIDAIIARQQEVIEKLKAYKLSVITEAVTKGLNLNVPMKHSGVEWIGEIPEHWSVVPLTKQLESIVDYRGKTPEKVDDGIFLVTARNIKNGMIDYSISSEYVKAEDYKEIMHRGIPQIGDVLFTTEAPLGQVANVDRTDIALAQRIIKFSTKNHLNSYFLKYWIMSIGFQNFLMTLSTGSTAVGIKASKLFMLPVPLAPMQAQNQIVTYLDKKCKKIESVIDGKQALIDKFTDYKKSLIYEVVTGKKEV